MRNLAPYASNASCSASEAANKSKIAPTNLDMGDISTVSAVITLKESSTRTWGTMDVSGRGRSGYV